MAIFAEFAACKDGGASADSAEAQALVAKLQSHITENYYTCTDEILAGLGKMYVADERFKKNIDKYGEVQNIIAYQKQNLVPVMQMVTAAMKLKDACSLEEKL